jgi:hypothetical protein
VITILSVRRAEHELQCRRCGRPIEPGRRAVLLAGVGNVHVRCVIPQTSLPAQGREGSTNERRTNMTSEPTALAVAASPSLTHDELVVLSDILGRVQTAVETNDVDLLCIASSFATRPAFATALEKIDDAKLASRPGQS